MDAPAASPKPVSAPHNPQMSLLKRVGVGAVLVGSLEILGACAASGPSVQIVASDAKTAQSVATMQVTVSNRSSTALHDLTAHVARHTSDTTTTTFISVQSGNVTILVPDTTTVANYDDATGVASDCGMRGSDVTIGDLAPGAARTCTIRYSVAAKSEGDAEISVVTHSVGAGGKVESGSLSQASGSRVDFAEVA